MNVYKFAKATKQNFQGLEFVYEVHITNCRISKMVTNQRKRTNTPKSTINNDNILLKTQNQTGIKIKSVYLKRVQQYTTNLYNQP